MNRLTAVPLRPVEAFNGGQVAGRQPKPVTRGSPDAISQTTGSRLQRFGNCRYLVAPNDAAIACDRGPADRRSPIGKVRPAKTPPVATNCVARLFAQTRQLLSGSRRRGIETSANPLRRTADACANVSSEVRAVVTPTVGRLHEPIARGSTCLGYRRSRESPGQVGELTALTGIHGSLDAIRQPAGVLVPRHQCREERRP